MAERNEDGIDSGGNYKDKTIKKSPYSKNLNGIMDYLTPNARQSFTQLKQTFIKALILQYFNLKCHIQIETDILIYVISRILSQLTLNNLG